MILFINEYDARQMKCVLPQPLSRNFAITPHNGRKLLKVT
jgi:hypothetical protein